VLEEFRAIYRDNKWGYGSGVGSLPGNNAGYIELVQSFLEKERVQSVVDFGCGDWQFSRLMDWKGATYVGLDLVPDLIEANRKAFGRAECRSMSSAAWKTFLPLTFFFARMSSSTCPMTPSASTWRLSNERPGFS